MSTAITPPLGGTGVMFATDRLVAAELTDFGRRVESLGLATVWVPELFGREPFATAAHLLAHTSTVQVGTLIANVYARDAVAAAAGRRTLAELSGGRFVLGLGVSNAGINRQRGHTWAPPATRMADYLDAMAAAELWSPDHDHPGPVLVAAHGPRMLDVAAAGADGVTTWLMTPEHTADVRRRLGTGAVVAPAQMALLCDDPAEARRLARRALAPYVGLAYYHRAWADLGLGADDVADGGADRLVDTLVAWGDADAVRGRIDAQRDAGADHVVIVPLNPRGGREPDWDLLDAVAPPR